MTIETMIDRNYCSGSVLEEMTCISDWLTDTPYFAIVDEELKVVGIIIPDDVIRNPQHLVIDCDFLKPTLSPAQSAEEVLDLMQKRIMSHLPVFDNNIFIGVVSLKDVISHIEHTAKSLV